MRLFIPRCKSCGKEINLKVIAETRWELEQKIGYTFTVLHEDCGNRRIYTVDDVYAKRGISNLGLGSAIGGALGLFGGPVGLLVGGGIGGVLGASADQNEDAKIRRFNRS